MVATTIGYLDRRAELRGPGVARLGEIYLYARFRNAVPAALVEEFGYLEPEVLAAIERLKEASKVRGWRIYGFLTLAPAATLSRCVPGSRHAPS